MLRAKTLTPLITVLLIAFFSNLFNRATQSSTVIRRVTNTPEQANNLNPSLSDDGLRLSFESTANLANVGGPPGFHCVTTNVNGSSPGFVEIARSRCVAPALSGDGSQVVFASTEDLLDQNWDRNSEIYIYRGTELQQSTVTRPDTTSSRLSDGNFQPSTSEDGRFIAFSSNRDLIGLNPDGNNEIFLFDSVIGSFNQLTSTQEPLNSADPKISGDGQRIIFTLNASTESGTDLLMYERSTKLTRPLLRQREGLTLSEGRAISRDGTRVVYAAGTGPNQSQVFLYDLSDSVSEELTMLGARTSDVKLNPTISGNGKRVAFTTRRNVVDPGDGSVELYVYDIPSRQIQQITNAPSSATGEVVSSLNYDGSLVAFNFPRVLSGSPNDTSSANNSEIYIADVQPRPAFGVATASNAASSDTEPAADKTLAPDSIVSIHGSALATRSAEASFIQQQLPFNLAGTSASIQGLAAKMLFVSPGEVILVLPSTLHDGPAEIVLSNADGFASKAPVMIKQASPGLFTFTGDGRGAGVIINADSFAISPLDPTDGRLRLVVFGTGVHHSANVSASINGEEVTVERIVSSALPGLDEIHLLIPTSLRGTGPASLAITADASRSNSVIVTLFGSPLREIMINEFLADPPDGLAGDANRDGVRNSSADEFVELVNPTSHDINIGRYQLLTRGTSNTETLRHRFAADTLLPAGTALVVFGGGNPDATSSAFGGAQVLKATSGTLSLLNSAGSIILRDDTGSTVSSVVYGPETGIEANNNQSITRTPDIDGPLTLHTVVSAAEGKLFSPGTRIDGKPFLANPFVAVVQVAPVTHKLMLTEKLQLIARAFDSENRAMDGVLFKWESSAPNIASVDSQGLATALAPGTAHITATARGVSSAPVDLAVAQPAPSPTPLSTPSASPGPKPSPGVSPSPTPFSSPSPLPTPSPGPTASPAASPTPSPANLPPLVISEFRTRGPNGASDEFIEIYNRGDTAINIGGFKLRASNSSGSVGTRLTINAEMIIPGHAHFLATNSAGYSGFVPGDQSFSSGITNDGGIALTLPDDTVIDQVGLSSGSAFREGMHLAPLPTNADQSYERKPGGLNGSSVDTGQNFDDFFLSSPGEPQNLSSPPTPVNAASPSPTPSASPSSTPGPSPSTSPSPNPSAMPSIVISQVFAGGGNSGASYRNDFIEIFNRGTVPIDLSGWSVQYSGATSVTWSTTSLSAISLAPGQYSLIQEGSAGAAGLQLPSPDASGTIAMSASGGKVALVRDLTALSGACPIGDNIVDFLGYGSTTSCFRGSGSAPAPGNTNAVLRLMSGCTNGGNNVDDFQLGAPNPRNTATMSTACVSSSSAKLVRWSFATLYEDVFNGLRRPHTHGRVSRAGNSECFSIIARAQPALQ